jgi:hypothetical protein
MACACAAFIALALCFGCDGNKSGSAIKLPPAVNTERMVSDELNVMVYVECVDRQLRQYKLRFVIKQPGSALISPILRMAGNPDAHSVVVNGVDIEDGDFAFSPNIEVFDKNLQVVTANYNTQALNDDDVLGRVYHRLISKYEKGN